MEAAAVPGWIRTALASALTVAACVAACIAAAGEPRAAAIRLANGLDVVAIEDRAAPELVVSVWYRVGSADEATGEEGVAHYLEHLLFWGSRDHPLGPFADTIEAAGGVADARTSWDFTGYWSRIPPDRLDLALAIEAARMHGFAFDAEVAARERGLVAEERAARVEAFPHALFDERRRAALFGAHPYGRPPIGWPDDIARLDRAVAEVFYRRRYRPQDAALVVVGPVAAAEVFRRAEAAFGPIPGGAPAARTPRPEPPQLAAGSIEMRDQRVRQPASGRLHRAPVRRPGDQAEAAALVVLDELLGGAPEHAVLGALVGDAGVADEAGSVYNPNGVDPQAFGVFVAPREGVSIEAAEAALDEAIAGFLATGPDPAGLAGAKARIVAELGVLRADPLALARHWGIALATGLSIDDVTDWPDALAAVTAEDVTRAARAVFRTETAVSGRLLP